MQDFDFIIVGAGSAGCVIANRLSQKYRVLLLEAGSRDRSPWLHVPIGYGKVYYDASVNWKYLSGANPALDGRAMYLPRGKTLGGSSAINAMVYVRGHPEDYARWDKVAKGWAWQDVEPIFRKLEDWQGVPNRDRGTGGPLSVYDISEDAHPLTRKYLSAAEQIGLPVNADYNLGSMNGACLYQITTRNGLRASTAKAYLGRGANKKNLRIETDAHVLRVMMEGKRAVGVEYRQFSQFHRQTAAEVILCAGAINSPQILELSGIGDGETLQKLGIPLYHHAPHVGQHLQDHLGVDFTFEANQPSLNQALYPWYGKLYAALQYLLRRKGPLSLSLNQGGGFVRFDGTQGIPELQLYFSPISYRRAPVSKCPLMNPDPHPGFLLGFNPCKPTSRGSVHLQSPDPEAAPHILPNYLDTEHDRRLMREGMRLMRKLATAPALSSVIAKELHPSIDAQSDTAFDDYIRETCWTVFHQCGTCRMGDEPHLSVVDSHLRVHGIQGLRVADASIFPEIPTGNTNAPAIMVGEAASLRILADHQP